MIDWWLKLTKSLPIHSQNFKSINNSNPKSPHSHDPFKERLSNEPIKHPNIQHKASKIPFNKKQISINRNSLMKKNGQTLQKKVEKKETKIHFPLRLTPILNNIKFHSNPQVFFYFLLVQLWVFVRKKG